MRVMVVGSGGREHALAWRLAQDTEVEQIWVAPGNAGSCGHNITALPARDIAQWVAAAQEHQIDLTVVGPEAPLADGIADAFARANLTLLGPQGPLGSVGSVQVVCQGGDEAAGYSDSSVHCNRQSG